MKLQQENRKATTTMTMTNKQMRKKIKMKMNMWEQHEEDEVVKEEEDEDTGWKGRVERREEVERGGESDETMRDKHNSLPASSGTAAADHQSRRVDNPSGELVLCSVMAKETLLPFLGRVTNHRGSVGRRKGRRRRGEGEERGRLIFERKIIKNNETIN